MTDAHPSLPGPHDVKRRVALAFGMLVTTAGAFLHLPMYVMARHDHYRLAGMAMDVPMEAGMACLVAGVAICTWAVVSARPRLQPMRVRVVNGSDSLGRHQRLLVAAIFVAFVIDSTKTSTIAFALPGMKREYGLSTQHASLLPLVALTGTTIGSFLWGAMADRLGRRASLELATVLFMATAVCGTMPSFNGNLVMCFFMGISAGGMVPIVYALLVETLPARNRGAFAVFLTTVGLGSGFGIIALLAQVAAPTYSWRILWLVAMPTTLVLLAIIRWVPESPGWLMRAGRVLEARQIMNRYEMTAVPLDARGVDAIAGRDGLRGLLEPALRKRSAVVAAIGLSWGLVNYGYFTLLPTFVTDQHISAGHARAVLGSGSLLAIPLSALATFVYRWLTPRTGIALYATATAAALVGTDVVVHSAAIRSETVAVLCLALLFAMANSLSAMIGPYTAEIYPLRLRGSAGGLTAGSGKLGGIVGPPSVAAALAFAGPALAVYPLGLLLVGTALTVVRFGTTVAAAAPAVEAQEAA